MVVVFAMEALAVGDIVEEEIHDIVEEAAVLAVVEDL
tara:strand:- start:1 stop:111 length:111 start_codon:yes stop_codon:yes gene_type:complete